MGDFFESEQEQTTRIPGPGTREIEIQDLLQSLAKTQVPLTQDVVSQIGTLLRGQGLSLVSAALGQAQDNLGSTLGVENRLLGTALKNLDINSLLSDEVLNLVRGASGALSGDDQQRIDNATRSQFEAGSSDILRAQQMQELGLDEELAPRLGLRKTDTPIQDRRALIRSEGLRQQGQLRRDLAGQANQLGLTLGASRANAVGPLALGQQQFGFQGGQYASPANTTGRAFSVLNQPLGTANAAGNSVGTDVLNLLKYYQGERLAQPTQTFTNTPSGFNQMTSSFDFGTKVLGAVGPMLGGGGGGGAASSFGGGGSLTPISRFASSFPSAYSSPYLSGTY